MIHWSEAALAEALAASLTAEPLERVVYAGAAIADEGMEVVIADAKVSTVRVGAVLVAGGDGFGATVRVFALGPGRDGVSGIRRVGGLATEGAVAGRAGDKEPRMM